MIKKINESDYLIIVDGGCLGNGTTEAKGYGSFEITTRDGRKKIIRLVLDNAITNNKAEYMSLIESLKHLSEIIISAKKSPEDYSVQIRMDSAIVINQTQSLWKCKSLELRVLCDEAKALLSSFSKFEFIKISGDEMKTILGH